MNEPALITIISTALLFWHLLSIGARYLADLLSQQLPGNQFSQFVDFTSRAVNQVEMQYSQGVGQGGLNSANKKKEALDTIELLCKEFKVKFNPDVADKLIEDAVLLLNASQGKNGTDRQPTSVMPIVPR